MQAKNQASLLTLVLIVIGSCIGSGIFMTPSQVASSVPFAALLIPIWVLGGLIALSGALSYGELAARFPSAGGVYAYLKLAYGNYAAFMFGWVVLMAVTSGAIAGLSIAFSNFLVVLIPMSDLVQKLVSVSIILICTVINARGLGIGQKVTGLITFLKVIGILGLIIAGLAFNENPVKIDWSLPNMSLDMLSPILIALVGVYWAYGGWHHLTYLSAELQQSKKRLSWAMLIGVFGVMLAYVAVNFAYLKALPIEEIARSKGIAAEMMEAVFPGLGGKILAGLVCLSVLGSILIYTMSAPRIYAAMAADGVFFSALAKTNPKTGTPVFAIFIQSFWAIILIFLWGTFGNLVDYVTYTEAVFLIMAAASVYIFRWRDRAENQNFEGFRVPGYPITPLIYVVISTAFVINGLIAKTDLAWAALLLLLLGTGLFLQFRSKSKT